VRILFISDNFPPEVYAPASRTLEHCREWVKTGHDVTVITCFPNFPQGKVYIGYSNQLVREEWLEGIHVIRVWSYITANDGFLKRIADYVSFMISATLVSQKLGNYDKIIGTSPQFFSAVAARIIGALKSTPYIFELRDIWPESIRAVGAMRNSIVLDWFENLELYLYHRSHFIISVTQSFKHNLISRGVRSNRIHVIRNGVDLFRFYPRVRNVTLAKELNVQSTFNIGYLGTHGMAHALETILETAKIFQQEMPDNGLKKNIRFILLGSGARKKALEAKSQELGLDNIIFIDSVSKELVPEYWSLLDLCVVHLKKTDLFRSVIPSKIFESMGMGIPIVHGVEGESADIIKDEGVGWTFEPENSISMAQAILKGYQDPELMKRSRANCRSAAVKFDRTILARHMIQILKQV